MDSINQKNSIMLSRNKPVALVVAAAGFLGSNLVDKLLEKDIQVIGVDDLETGEKQNLLKASENRNFHLLLESPDKLDLDLPRLDYIFITSSQKWNLDKVLQLFKEFKSRCLLISSIDLYEKSNQENLKQLKEIEGKIAKFASEFHLNARVLRLGPVYGPRMDFTETDPLHRLIQQSLTGDLQKDVTLEFSSRALFIKDAVDLIIRTIFAGSTSQKIFDGVSINPVKVTEIKQVLLDPVWYENKDFTPTELPPWPTPNLNKTIKFLNWQPKDKLVASLKETISYFKENEIPVPKVADEEIKTNSTGQEAWKEEKKEELESFKEAAGANKPKKWKVPQFSLPVGKIYLMAIILLITYAIIWPGFILGWGIFSFNHQLDLGFTNLEKGDLENSLGNINQAYDSAVTVRSMLGTLEPARKTGLFKKQFELGDDLTNMAVLSTASAKSAVLGIQALLQSIKAVTGESVESPAAYFTTAQTELTAASGDISKTTAILKNRNFNSNLPVIEKLTRYSSFVSKAQTLSILLPELVAIDGSKNYLVLLQNNMELRPGGGFIGSFAKISFEGGKLKKLEVNDIYNIDGNLSIHVEPPKEIKEDLGQKNWFLRDSNWEPDFPTSAKQAEWFFTKETGDRVDGVLALDISAMEDLLKVIGPIDLPDYNEKITADNLFTKAVTHAELSFFPGSQDKKSFLTALTSGVFNKIFFSPQKNWPGIIAALGRSLDNKHISIYLDDPKLFSYVMGQNWAGVLPRAAKDNQNQDFLSVVEANLGANKANYYLNRNYNLETMVGKDGEVKHKLRIGYTNTSPSDAFPGGKYKNRMRVYLPFGSKLTRALWGESEITKDVTSFVDYGRTGYSMLLELNPKEQKKLVLDYSVPIKLEFQNGKAAYRLDIIKQAGTVKDPFAWTITYPISYKVVSNQTNSDSTGTKVIGPHEQTISTDLSTDRSFEIEFTK